MDVDDWLRSLGLERYATAFRENAVDAKILPTLTADDLKEMGIVPIGHRRQLLNAIAALRPNAVTDEGPDRVSSSPVPADAGTPTGVSETTAERRPLSVMFCDLTPPPVRPDPGPPRRSTQMPISAKCQGFACYGYPSLDTPGNERLIASGVAMVPEPAAAALLGGPPPPDLGQYRNAASNRLASTPGPGQGAPVPGTRRGRVADCESAAEGATGPRKRSGTRDRGGRGTSGKPGGAQARPAPTG